MSLLSPWELNLGPLNSFKFVQSGQPHYFVSLYDKVLSHCHRHSFPHAPSPNYVVAEDHSNMAN